MTVSDRNRIADEISETGHPSEILLTEYREGLLPLSEDTACEEHVSACGECQEALALIATLTEQVLELCSLLGS